MASQVEQNIVMYSAEWCADCRRSKRLLDKYDVPYTLIDIDANPEAARQVVRINNGLRRIPTIIFPDGSVLVEPSDKALAQKLGLESER